MRSLLRNRVEGEHARVGFVELFFDLVFVFAITQVSHGLLAHLTPLGALQAAMLLAAVWWAWIFTSWATNWLDPEREPVQIALFVLMGIGLVMSAALPHAFQEKGLVFALAFAGIQVGRTAFMAWASRKGMPMRSLGLWLSSAPEPCPRRPLTPPSRRSCPSLGSGRWAPRRPLAAVPSQRGWPLRN